MKTRAFILILVAAMLLSSCQSTEPSQPASLFPGVALTPYATHTVTPTATATSPNAPTATLAPTMTSIPMTYISKSSDSLWSIAAKNGLSIDEIKAANPDINPYLLGPGTLVVIPAPSGQTTEPTQNLPAVTPVPMDFSDPQCTASLSGGTYCFAELINPQPVMMDGLGARFSLTDHATGEVLTQSALLPLNRIAGGGRLPLFAYFPPPVPVSPQIGLQLLTSISVNQNGTPSPLQSAVVTVDQTEINISVNRLSAVVTAQAKFDSNESVTGRIWIAAVAYDASGKIMGIRRFVSPNAMNPDDAVPFTLNIYSIGEKIDNVVLFGEVNP